MSFARWLWFQLPRRDAVGRLAGMLVGWATSPADVQWGPAGLLETHDLARWALVAHDLDQRGLKLTFSGACDRANHEFRLSLNGQPSHTPGQWRAVTA